MGKKHKPLAGECDKLYMGSFHNTNEMIYTNGFCELLLAIFGLGHKSSFMGSFPTSRPVNCNSPNLNSLPLGVSTLRRSCAISKTGLCANEKFNCHHKKKNMFHRQLRGTSLKSPG